MNKLSAVLAGAIFILSFTGWAGAREDARADHAMQMELAPQPLADALNKLSEMMNLQFVFYSDVGRGIAAPRLSGAYTARQALDRLLADTGLYYEYLDA